MTGEQQWQPRFPEGARLAALNGETWIVVGHDHFHRATIVDEGYGEPVALPEEYLENRISGWSVSGGGLDAGERTEVFTAPTGESPAVLPQSDGGDGRRSERGEAVDPRGSRSRARHVADWRRGSTQARQVLGVRRQRAQSAPGILRDRAQARRTRLRWLRALGWSLALSGAVGLWWVFSRPLTTPAAAVSCVAFLVACAGVSLATLPAPRKTSPSRHRRRKK